MDKRVKDISTGTAEVPESPDQASLVRLSARFCHLLRDANQKTWFDRTVRAQVDGLRDEIRAAAGDASLELKIGFESLRLREAHLENPPKAVRQFINMFRRKGIQGCIFDPEVDAFDVVVLCQILQTRSPELEQTDVEQLQKIRFEREVKLDRRIEMPEVILPSKLGGALRDDEDADLEVRNLVTDITGAIEGLTGGKTARPQATETKHGSGLLELVDQLGHNAEIALILSSLQRHDAYTYDHSINVGLLSICLARYIGWKGVDLHEFGIAALIHDVGKLYTPLEVLNKPGRLSPAEWIVMKRHPRDGYEILKEGGVGSDMAPYIALEHHIGPDGEGYPPLAYGPDRIHPGSQIVRIADIYDAFTTIRPYRSQARPTEVLKMLRKQGKNRQLDADFVEAFCEMMGDFPIGSSVRLSNGRIGLVVDVHPEEPQRPLVRILRDERGREVRKLQLVDLRDMNEQTGQYLESIEEIIDPVIRNIDVGRYI